MFHNKNFDMLFFITYDQCYLSVSVIRFLLSRKRYFIRILVNWLCFFLYTDKKIWILKLKFKISAQSEELTLLDVDSGEEIPNIPRDYLYEIDEDLSRITKLAVKLLIAGIRPVNAALRTRLKAYKPSYLHILVL